MDDLYQLLIINDTAKKELSLSPYFEKIQDGVYVCSKSENEARKKAYEMYPMEGAYDIIPSARNDEHPIIVEKYTDLWINKNLTSCELKQD